MDVLKRFMGYAEAKPLHATNAKDLVHKIKWAATTATGTATNQKSATSQDKAVDTNVIQAPPPEDVVVDPNDPNAGFVFP